MKITDHLVQLLMEDEYDKSVLQRESFPVNIRLYKINDSYRRCILEIVRYMSEHLHSQFEDYTEPRGVAAANLGFPFRIIGYKKNSYTTNPETQFMLNPKITWTGGVPIEVTSNCGSLRLSEPRKTKRHPTIDVEYYDLEANKHTKTAITRNEGGFTIQHEINQTNGKTLIDE